jgi:hypothetical protein
MAKLRVDHVPRQVIEGKLLSALSCTKEVSTRSNERPAFRTNSPVVI